MSTERQKAKAAARARAYRARQDPAKATFEARRHRLWQKYKLTVNAYDKLLDSPEGLCAICGTDEPGGQGNDMNVDHDHDTGKVRGLLCTNCNQGLGHLGDDPERLDAAAAYLRLHSESL